MQPRWPSDSIRISRSANCVTRIPPHSLLTARQAFPWWRVTAAASTAEDHEISGENAGDQEASEDINGRDDADADEGEGNDEGLSNHYGDSKKEDQDAAAARHWNKVFPDIDSEDFLAV